MAISPLRLWDGPSSYFELLLVPRGARYIVYDRSSRHFPPLKPGMLLFLRLVVGESVAIPVGLQITRMDPAKDIIQLTYLEQNVTHGVQTITFTADGTGTKVTQVSRFSSGRFLRDLLYPYYHRMVLEDFYHHMKELLGKRAR